MRLQKVFYITKEQYQLLSPSEGAVRSTLVFVSHRNPSRNRQIYEKLLEHRIFVAYRSGKLRFSPHLYNTLVDIDKALAVLNAA